MATSNNSKSGKSSKAAPVAPVAPAAKPISKPVVKASVAPPPPAKAAPPPAKAAPQAAKVRAPYEPTQEEIQTRAFEIYVSEGCKEGNDLEYWVRAEKELRSV
jgi:hypothetical protein